MSEAGVVGELVAGMEVITLWAVGEESPRKRKEKDAWKKRLTGKELGEMAEASFLAKAAGMGLWVAKPWGDSRPYDFIVDADGVLRRVQVKSAYRVGKNMGYSFRAHGHVSDAYREDEIDALVAYVVPEDAWYLFPVKVFRKMKSLKLFPGSRRKRSKFEKWREAWWVLERGRRG